MYEPEKILVQNAGIDPGVAALLQNANKGNMDPAALMAMMNNRVQITFVWILQKCSNTRIYNSGFY